MTKYVFFFFLRWGRLHVCASTCLLDRHQREFRSHVFELEVFCVVHSESSQSQRTVTFST